MTQPTSSAPEPHDEGPPKAWPIFAGTVLILLPGFAFFLLLFSVAVNIPYLDDYDTVLDFLLQVRTPESPSGTLELIFAPHVEHRLVLLKGTALAMMGLTGSVNFAALVTLGCLGLVALTAGLFAAWRRDSDVEPSLLWFAPVSLLLFQPQFWDVFFWATSSLSNQWVLPIVLFALMCLDGGGRGRSFGAAGLAMLAALTQGNGLLVFPAGLVVLFLRGRIRAAGAWAVFSLAVGGAYVLGLEPVEGVRSPLETLADAPAFLHYAVNFLGSAAGFSDPILSPIFGALIVASAAALFATGMPRRNPVLYALLLLIIASACLNAFARGHINGAAFALDATRYRFYASAGLAVSYVCWANWLSERAHGGAYLAAASLAFSGLSYGAYRVKAMKTSVHLSLGLGQWKAVHRGLRYPKPPRANRILRQSLEAGIYRPERFQPRSAP